MKLANIKQALKQALIQDGEMSRKLYEYELEEHLDYLKSSMIKDRDDFIFVVTVRINTLTSNHDVAMLLMENSGKIHINESARDRLQELWRLAYSSNMHKLIPEFARQLKNNELPINGVKTIKKFMA